MKKYIQTLYLILLAFLLLACSAAIPATAEPLPTPSKASEVFHPLTTRSGIEDVDKVLDVVASGDIQVLRSLIQFTNTRCTTAEGLGGPPKCRAGEAEGTPVEVLPILGPEGHFFHREDIQDWIGVDAAGLYAIYEVSTEVISDPDYPSGRYAVMFFDKENQSVISLRIANGRIVRVDYILDTSPEILNEWIQREASNVILAPVNS
jgi:hypothetical protein